MCLALLGNNSLYVSITLVTSDIRKWKMILKKIYQSPELELAARVMSLSRTTTISFGRPLLSLSPLATRLRILLSMHLSGDLKDELKKLTTSKCSNVYVAGLPSLYLLFLK